MKKTKKNITLDDLAGMVASGFEGVQNQLHGLEHGQKGLKAEVEELKQGQEQIKLKLDNVAYRFELVE